MLTEIEIREMIASYIPPYHHEIRDEIYKEIIACGEEVLGSVQPLLDDSNLKHRQRALLERALWAIGGNLIKDFFIERAEYNPGSRSYIKELPREDLLHLREINPELLKKVFTYLPEDIISYCVARQHQMKEELQQLGLTIQEETFEVAREQTLNPHSIKDCPVCGKDPYHLLWIYFWTPSEDWQKMRGRAGWIGLCDECNIQVSWVIREMN
jgi:hypothetical protein